MIDRSELTYNLLDIGLISIHDQTHICIENHENPLEFKDLEYKTSICVAAPSIYRILLEQAGIKPGHGMMFGQTNALIIISIISNICTQIEDPCNDEALCHLEEFICAHMDNVPDWKLFIGMRN